MCPTLRLIEHNHNFIRTSLKDLVERDISFNRKMCEIITVREKKNIGHTYKIFVVWKYKKEEVINSNWTDSTAWDSCQQANIILGCIRRNITSKKQKVTIICHLPLVRSLLDYSLWFWTSHFQKKTDSFEQGQRTAAKMIINWTYSVKTGWRI